MSETNMENEPEYMDEDCELFRACNWKLVFAVLLVALAFVLWLLERYGVFAILSFF